MSVNEIERVRELAQRRAELKTARDRLDKMLEDVDRKLHGYLTVEPVQFCPVVIKGIQVDCETDALPTREWCLNGGFDKSVTSHSYPTVSTIAASLAEGIPSSQLAEIFDDATTLATVTRNLRTGEVVIDDEREKALYRLSGALKNRLNGSRVVSTFTDKRRDTVRQRNAIGR